LLPLQLIPYFQYTVQAVIGVLLLALKSWESGQQGFHGAAARVDPDSSVTPWLVAYWLTAVLRGFRHAHAILMRWYDLSGPGWPLENPPSMAGSKSPSDRVLISTSFFGYRQSYLFFIPYFSFL